MSTIRQTLTPMLERKNLEITRLRTELEKAKARIVELEAQLNLEDEGARKEEKQ